MKQRGKQSVNSLSVAKQGVTEQERHPPPPELTDEQRFEWLRVVNAVPAEWFRDFNTQTLVQYCKHVVNARRIGQLIESACDSDEFDILAYDKLLAMQERESRILLSLMTKMRLTQQSTYSDRKSTGNVTKARKPWE